MATIQDLHEQSLIWPAPYDIFSITHIDSALLPGVEDAGTSKAVITYADKNATIKVSAPSHE